MLLKLSPHERGPVGYGCIGIAKRIPLPELVEPASDRLLTFSLG